MSFHVDFGCDCCTLEREMLCVKLPCGDAALRLKQKIMLHAFHAQPCLLHLGVCIAGLFG